jgi:hypothetical protein
MPWECGECRQKETDVVKITALCHHCGKPLCNKHSIVILDDAFADFEGAISNIAFHCDSCKKAYHPNITIEQIIIKNIR